MQRRGCEGNERRDDWGSVLWCREVHGVVPSLCHASHAAAAGFEALDGCTLKCCQFFLTHALSSDPPPRGFIGLRMMLY